jgi:thioredoxin 1
VIRCPEANRLACAGVGPGAVLDPEENPCSRGACRRDRPRIATQSPRSNDQMPSPVDLDERSFDRILAAYDLLVVDFWAHWCRPCRAMGPVVERLGAEHPEVLVAKVDVDHDRRLARRLSIRSVPTIMRFDHGRPTAVVVGAVPYDRLLSALRLGHAGKPGAPTTRQGSTR